MDTAIIRYKYQLVNHRRNNYLNRPIDIAGTVWNYCVSYQRWAYKNTGKYISKYDMMKHVAKLRNNVDAFSHWQVLNSQAVKEICDRLDKAYQRFFKKLGGKPKFRKSKLFRSFVLQFSEKHWGRGNGSGCKILDWGDNGYGKIRITIGKKKHVFKFHTGNRPLSQCGTLKSVTVKRTGVGKFWLSFVVETKAPKVSYPSTGKIGGFDFGLLTFLTDDSSNAIESPQYLFASLDQLRKRGKKLSGRGRKTIGSGSWKRAKLDVSRLHAKINNRRIDWHWKLAHQLCEEYDVLCFEDLSLEGMRRLWGRKIGDLALSEFKRKLEWVAEKAGRQVVYIDKWYPSSKICSECGIVKEAMSLDKRTFECECGYAADRDVNAARNIRAEGIRILAGTRQGTVLGKSGVSDSKLFVESVAPVLTTRPS